MNIFLGILASILFLGMVRTKEQQDKNNYATCFVVVMLVIFGCNFI